MSSGSPNQGAVLALSGGVGGAKLALGLSRILEPGKLAVVANTGDDFEHLGLMISPDLDTLLYTLSGLNDPVLGWGRKNETWTFMTALADLGGETWFRIGDGDLALHIERTRRLAQGETLTAIMNDFRGRFGIKSRLFPMSDDPVRTKVRTVDKWLDFQDYFVRLQCEPKITGVKFEGAECSRPNPNVMAALADPGLRAVVICPSNPLISIEPILAVPGIRQLLAGCRAPVIAVSPIIGGQAIKGPTVKMLKELGYDANATEVALRYKDILDGYVIDAKDAAYANTADIPVRITNIIMKTLEDRENLARVVLDFADELAASENGRSVKRGGR